MNKQYLKKSDFTLFRKQKGIQAEASDWGKLLINIISWFVLTLTIAFLIETLTKGSVKLAYNGIEDNLEQILMNLLTIGSITSVGLLFKRTHFVVTLMGYGLIVLAWLNQFVLTFRDMPLTWIDLYNKNIFITAITHYTSQPFKIQPIIFCLIGVVSCVIAYKIKFKVYQMPILLRLIVTVVLIIVIVMLKKNTASSFVEEARNNHHKIESHAVAHDSLFAC